MGNEKLLKVNNDVVEETEYIPIDELIRKSIDSGISNLSLSDLEELISLMRIRNGHWSLTHNFQKNDFYEEELKFIINRRNAVSSIV